MVFNLCQIFSQIIVVSVGFGGDGATDSDESLFWSHSRSQGLPPFCRALWFPDAATAIVLCDAISTDTLKMSSALE